VPRPIRKIEIFLPLEYNDGRPIEEAKFAHLEDELLTRFGGVTSVQRQFPLRGLWRFKAETFQDRVVVFAVMDFQSKSDLEVIRYLERLKGRLKKKLSQLEILITLQDLVAI
jgi:hypothetical protein